MRRIEAEIGGSEIGDAGVAECRKQPSLGELLEAFGRGEFGKAQFDVGTILHQPRLPRNKRIDQAERRHRRGRPGEAIRNSGQHLDCVECIAAGTGLEIGDNHSAQVVDGQVARQCHTVAACTQCQCRFTIADRRQEQLVIARPQINPQRQRPP